MLLKFKVRSDKAEKFIMYIEADTNNTFYQLHEIIQEECKHDPSEPASFFLADEEWDKRLEIKMFKADHVHTSTSSNWVMKKTRLGDIVKEEEDKLIYVFDTYNPKSLYIELNEIEMEKTMIAPVITLSKGIAPIQILDKNNDFNLIVKDDPDSENMFEDLGELEDLNEIYGEMSNIM